MVRRLWFSAAMLTVGTALLVAAGVAWSAGSAEAPKGGTLRLGSVDDIVSVDPALSYEFPLEFATCAKLFNYPDASGAAGTRLVPEVVKSWAVSKDGRTYDLELKRSFRFHTGAPVTARSFKDAFNRDANPRLESPAKDYMEEIVGAVAVIEGKAKAISGVRVLGTYRLQIKLTRPVGDFTARLTMPFFCPILPNTRIVPEGIDNPPGSGPYYVAERVVNRRIVLKRNPYYPGGRPANVNQMVITVGGTSEGCLLDVEQDRLDVCLGLVFPNTTTVRRLAEQYGINRPGGQFFRYPVLSTPHFVFNHDRPAFKGPGQIPLKKAINYAIDRPEFLRSAFTYLAGTRTDQMLPPALGQDASIYPLRGADLTTARRWYARAKNKPQTLVFYAANNRFGIAIAQTLQFNLKQIGIELEVKYYDFFTRAEKLGTRGEPFDISYNNWQADYADPAAFFDRLLDPNFRAKGNTNVSYYSNPRVSARIEAASRLRGPARLKALADLDADLMRDDPPWAPISHFAERIFISPSYGCFLHHPVYGVDLAAACKKK